MFTDASGGINCPAFAAVTAADAVLVIGRLPDKSLAANSIPISVLKAIFHLDAPNFVELFNRS